MNAKEFKQEVVVNSLKDIEVELGDEFDRNFSRKGFFKDNGWEARKYDDGRGSLMSRSGSGLRQSIRSRKRDDKLVFTSSKPYARIHNEGGDIKVTAKMKRYFWAKYYEASKRYGYKKNGEKRGDKRNRELSAQAEFYQRMALKQVGSAITMPERRFIGHCKETDAIIRDITEANISAYFQKHNPFER